MLITCCAGLLVAWPLYRLSQPWQERAAARSLLDAVTLICLWQLLLWPVRLATTWSVESVVAIDLWMISCLASVAGIIAAATALQHPVARSAAIIFALLIAIGAPLPLALIGESSAMLNGIFPGALTTLIAMLEATSTVPQQAQWRELANGALINGMVGLIGFSGALIAGKFDLPTGTRFASGRRLR